MSTHLLDSTTDDVKALAEPARAYVEAHRDDFVRLLKQLVEIETPSDQPATMAPLLRVLSDAFDDAGLVAHRLPGDASGGMLYARPPRRGDDRSCQLLLGHADTVWPVGTLAAMPAVCDGDTFRGPGSFDMKAGLVQMVLALRTLRALGIDPPLVPLVLVTTDEEVGSAESAPTIRRLARVVRRTFVLEPALGRRGLIKTERKGTGEFEIVIRGKSAHAGIAPEEGRSAILEMTYIVQRLFKMNAPARGVTVNVGTLDGGIRPNMVAPTSRITVDVRVPDAAEGERLETTIRSLQPRDGQVTLEVHGGIDRPPLARTPRNQALWHLCRRLGEALGIELDEGSTGGGSDGNLTSPHTATLDGLGAVGDGAHAEHEHVDVPRTLERTALLALLLAAPPVRPP